VGASLDLAEILALAKQPTRFVALSDDSVSFLFACSAFYQSRFVWRVDGVEPTDAEWDTINKLIGKAEFELMNSLVGLIFPHGLSSLSGLPMLACDGAIYNRVDYPILYSKIDTAYIIDADTFSVPDMRDRVPVGVGGDFVAGDTGGEQNHLLTIDEMPLHSHTNDPHAHSEIAAIPALADFGTGAPVPSATASAASTGLASITIHNTGGTDSHNNMQPYLAVAWAIVAG